MKKAAISPGLVSITAAFFLSTQNAILIYVALKQQKKLKVT